MFRYWVKIQNLESGIVRTLELRAFKLVALIDRKKGHAEVPDRISLELMDGETKIEAESLDGIASLLREKYSDGEYIRTLHYERDVEAEARRADAIDQLARIFAETALASLRVDEA